MKQRLFYKLLIILPAVLGLSLINIGTAFAADPVTVRYEVTSFQTSLDFVTYHNGSGPVTELLSEGTTTWSYQFTTANPGQPVSVFPVPVDNSDAAISMVSKVYINDVLYRTATGQNAVTASINDTLGNLLAAGPAHQWAIRYEITAQQTTLGLVTYSNNHTLGQTEILAAGTTVWTYQFTTNNVDQAVKLEAVPVAPNDPNRYYAIAVRVFVNNDLLYSATFSPNTQPAVINVNLNDLLTRRAQQTWQLPEDNPGVEIIGGTSFGSATRASANYTTANANQPYMINFKQMMFGDSDQVRTAGFSFFTNDRFFFVAAGTAPQLPAVPVNQESPGFLLASIPAQQ